jgi:hypothetical protein
MPEQDAGARELQHPQKIADVVFPSGDEPAGVVEPGKEPFDFPATTIAAQRPAVLGAPPPRAIRRDHLDAVLVAQLGVEQITVVPTIPDQSRREFAEEAGVEGRGDEVRLIR